MKTDFRLILPLLLALPMPAFAVGPVQDLDALERQLVIALGADIGHPGGPRVPVDRRLKLAACPTDLTIDPPRMGAATVRCAALGWRIRVPLLPGGRESDPVAMSAIVPAPRAEPVIRRGDAIELATGARGFTVTSEVIAQRDGAVGDRIPVRADSKSAPLMVVVVDAGHARMPGFKDF